MHELSLAHSIGEIAYGTLRESAPESGWRVERIRVRIGDFSGVDADALQFCFEVVRGEWEEVAGAALVIERCPARARCRGCGAIYEFTVDGIGCTECGEVGRDMLSGRELEVFGVELAA
jgi:hydrogenase nickel incorporation protein HypA/HybF